MFSEPVTAGAAALVVLNPASRPVSVDRIESGRDGRAVTGRITEVLPPGVYTIRWRVTGTDGDLVESTFRFAAGAAVTGPGDTGSAAAGGTSWPAVGWRWLLFAGLAEPYSAGVAPQVVQMPAEADRVRLAVGFPAEGRYVQLLLDRQNRIIDETLVDAKHLTRRRFLYPQR